MPAKKKMPERSYWCDLCGGNEYDFIVFTVSISEAQKMCTPCFITIASKMMTAMIDPADPEVAAILESYEPSVDSPFDDDAPTYEWEETEDE